MHMSKETGKTADTDALPLRAIPPLDQASRNADLIESACREGVHTARVILAHLEACGPLMLSEPEKFGKLALAAIDLVGKAKEGLAGLAQLRDADAPGDNAPAREDDPLERAFAAYRKATGADEA